MRLLLLFIAIPLIEIALFIQVGTRIGLWPTLLIVVITAFLGTFLVRQQGLQVLGQVQRSFNELTDPVEPLAHGAMILFSGALLLTPGFFTDALGFLMLVPAVRMKAFQLIRRNVHVAGFSTHNTAQPQQPRPGAGPVIDGEFEELEPKRGPSDTPSGWTRH
ncbi:MAG: FxsA family protein [Pseudomonadota bacterium]